MSYRIVLFLASLTLAACSAPPSPEPAAPPMVGGDRDAHGCVGSAGYSWCAHTAQCERPWELAQAQNFAVSQQAFDQFCGKPR